jgi:hypothetical protein
MRLRHWPRFNGAPMAHYTAAPLAKGAKLKLNGAMGAPLALVFGAPMAQWSRKGPRKRLILYARQSQKWWW